MDRILVACMASTAIICIHVVVFVFSNCGLFFLHMIYRNVVELWEKRGIHLMAWTVDGKEEANYFSKNIGVSILMDKPCTLN